MKKFFSVFAATVLMLSFVACDKKDKSKDEPQSQDTPAVVENGVNLTIDSESGLVEWYDMCATYGWWQIAAQNEDYFITLSNSSSVSSAPGIYTVPKLDPEYSYISDFAKDSAKVELKSGKIILTVDDDGNVAIVGSIVGVDGLTYKIDLKYFAPEVIPSDLTFEFNEGNEGITVTPSNDVDPWDYYIASSDLVAYYTADGIAEAVFGMYGDQYAASGAYTFPWEEIYEWCYDEQENFVPGQYVLVVWGASETGVTTDAATYAFTVRPEDEPAGVPAKKAQAKSLCNLLSKKQIIHIIN